MIHKGRVETEGYRDTAKLNLYNETRREIQLKAMDKKQLLK